MTILDKFKVQQPASKFHQAQNMIFFVQTAFDTSFWNLAKKEPRITKIYPCFIPSYNSTSKTGILRIFQELFANVHTMWIKDIIGKYVGIYRKEFVFML